MAPHPLIDTKNSGKQSRSAMVSADAQGFKRTSQQQSYNTPPRVRPSAGGAGSASEEMAYRPDVRRHPRNPAINDVEMEGRNPSMRRGRVSNGGGMHQMNSATMGNSSMMGYNSYGMMPMGGMGYYGGMGYGMGGMGGMMGPMGMIYSINYFISTMGQFASMFGMSTHAIGHLLYMARENLLKLEKTVRQSELRRWLQKKSEKSTFFRWAVIIVSMLAATQIVRLARYLIEVQLSRGGNLLTNGICSMFASSNGVSSSGSISSAGLPPASD